MVSKTFSFSKLMFKRYIYQCEGTLVSEASFPIPALSFFCSHAKYFALHFWKGQMTSMQGVTKTLDSGFSKDSSSPLPRLSQ